MLLVHSVRHDAFSGSSKFRRLLLPVFTTTAIAGMAGYGGREVYKSEQAFKREIPHVVITESRLDPDTMRPISQRSALVILGNQGRAKALMHQKNVGLGILGASAGVALGLMGCLGLNRLRKRS